MFPLAPSAVLVSITHRRDSDSFRTSPTSIQVPKSHVFPASYLLIAGRGDPLLGVQAYRHIPVRVARFRMLARVWRFGYMIQLDLLPDWVWANQVYIGLEMGKRNYLSSAHGAQNCTELSAFVDRLVH